MSIEDIKARAIKTKLGEPLQITNPTREETKMLPLFPQDLPDKKFNRNGASICFVSENTLYVLPYHSENYVELLEEAGYERDENLYVPYSDGISYPEDHKNEWLKMMEKSRATA